MFILYWIIYLFVGCCVWSKFVCVLCCCDNVESVAEILLLEELSCVVAACTLWVLDGCFNLDSLVCCIALDGDLVCEVVAELVDLHVGVEVLDEFLELEEAVIKCVGAVDVEDVCCGHLTSEKGSTKPL